MSPLRDARFRRLYLGQAVSAFGSRSLWLAAGMWVLQLTDSYTAAGLVFLALGLPTLLGPLAGAAVDRSASRRTLLIIVNTVMAAALLALLLVQSRADVWLVYVVTVLYGFAGTFISAARSALQKDLLRDDQLVKANALQTTTTQGISVIGPLVGAALFAAFGGRGLAILDAATFLIAAGLLWSITVAESEPEPPESTPYMHEVTAGFRHIARVPELAQAVLMVGIAFSVIGFSETTQFAVVREGLGRPVSFLGVLSTAQGVGAILGGLVVVAVVRRVGTARTLGLSLLSFGGGAALTLSSSTPLVLCGTLMDGIAVTWLLVPTVTAIQRHTPPRQQGRAGAAAELMIVAPQQASIALGAALIAVTGYRTLIGAITGIMLVCALVLLVRPVLDPVPEGPALAPSPAPLEAAMSDNANASPLVGPTSCPPAFADGGTTARASAPLTVRSVRPPTRG